MKADNNVRPFYWKGDSYKGSLFLLDQTKLPTREEIIEVKDLECALDAIRKLKVRGAPLLGVFGLLSLTIGLREATVTTIGEVPRTIASIASAIKDTRPTAVNLGREIDRFLEATKGHMLSIEQLAEKAYQFALSVQSQDEEANQRIAEHAFDLIIDGGLYLTHCNTGSLATSGIGTALGILKHAARMGKKITVISAESRPLLQGSRLTAYELSKENIPFKITCEGALGYIYSEMPVSGVFVGADRIAVNGDTANKVGTMIHAKLAKEKGVPFFIAAPMSTFDPNCPNGTCIPIEMRGSEEVSSLFGVQTAPQGIEAVNPAFDVTPAEYISGFITEKGILHPPF